MQTPGRIWRCKKKSLTSKINWHYEKVFLHSTICSGSLPAYPIKKWVFQRSRHCRNEYAMAPHRSPPWRRSREEEKVSQEKLLKYNHSLWCVCPWGWAHFFFVLKWVLWSRPLTSSEEAGTMCTNITFSSTYPNLLKENFSFFIKKSHSKICVIQKKAVPLWCQRKKETLTI